MVECSHRQALIKRFTRMIEKDHLCGFHLSLANDLIGINPDICIFDEIEQIYKGIDEGKFEVLDFNDSYNFI